MVFAPTGRLSGRAPTHPTMHVECPICFEPPCRPTELACGHVFCRACAEAAVLCNRLRCPVCRREVTAFPRPPAGWRDVVVHPPAANGSAHVGVTLANHRRGVRVVRTATADLAHGVLAAGTVVRSINGVPTVHHELAVRLVDACARARVPIVFELPPPLDGAERARVRDLRAVAERALAARRAFHPEGAEEVG